MTLPVSGNVYLSDFSGEPYYSVDQPPITSEDRDSNDQSKNYLTNDDIKAILTFIASNPHSISYEQIVRLSSLVSDSKLKRATEFFSMLSTHLFPLGFSASNEYSDIFGARVIDFFKDSNRITCIVSSEQVQIISFLGDIFDEKSLVQSNQTESKLIQYIQTLLHHRLNEKLDSATDSS